MRHEPVAENPWGLTHREERALAAIALHGLVKLAAEALGEKVKAVHNCLERARRKIGVRYTLQAAVAYDRFRRGAK